MLKNDIIGKTVLFGENVSILRCLGWIERFCSEKDALTSNASVHCGWMLREAMYLEPGAVGGCESWWRKIRERKRIKYTKMEEKGKKQEKSDKNSPKAHKWVKKREKGEKNFLLECRKKQSKFVQVLQTIWSKEGEGIGGEKRRW